VASIVPVIVTTNEAAPIDTDTGKVVDGAAGF
jgi:hypothetical protein